MESPKLVKFAQVPFKFFRWSLSGSVLLFTLSVSAPSTYAQVNLDSDSDNLLDAWEIMHFGSLSDPDGNPGDDPDGDGKDNLNESEANTDPLDPNSCLAVTVSSTFNAADFEIKWSSVIGKKYHIELSTDLQTWTKISDNTGTTPYDFVGTGGEIIANFANPAMPLICGAATREVWFDSSIQSNLSDFKSYVDNGGSELPPQGTEWRPSLKTPTEYGTNYGDRYRGFIVPETTGTYNFYIAGRHQCEFWLDTTGDTEDGTGLQRESFLNDNNLTDEEDWDYLASQGLNDTQKSRSISLTAGQKYFFEVWHTHWGQLDHLSVAWELNGSGNISVVSGHNLAPNVDYTDNNVAPFLTQPICFARVVTYSPLGNPNTATGPLDSDGDGLDDSTESTIEGFNPFLSQSAVGGQSDGVSITNAAAVSDPTTDTMTVVTTDALAREDNGLTGSGIPRIKDVARFNIRRSGSLEPQTVYFTVSGTSNPNAAGSASSNDFVLETPTEEPIPESAGMYAVTLPFGAQEVIVEARSMKDEVVEYPEQLTITLFNHADYQIGASNIATADIHDARDDPEFNKYYIATFSKDAAAVTSTSASGATVLVLNGTNREATVDDFFENLTSTQTNTHLHRATLKPDGITFDSGPVVETITDDGTETGTAIMGPVSNYTYLIEPRAGFTQQDLIDSLEFDNPKQGNPVGTTPLYNNKHTMMNGSGEIWAIYRRQSASELSPTADDRIPATPTIEPIDPVTEPDKLRREVARFLTQATFGPTEADIEELVYQIENVHGGDRIAAFDAWITAQWAVPQTLVRDLLHALDMQEFVLRGYFDPARNGAASTPPVAPANWPSWPSQDISNFDSLNISTWQSPDANFPLTSTQENQLDGPLGSPNHNNRRRAQWTVMTHGKDQLRQRVGFALSEITVVSEELNNIRQHHIAAARWIDMLAENADDHFRELIEDVTYSPIMGKYLSHLQNSSEAASGVPPDENYAREIMQLFTIGLLELWDDGFVKLDPTEYDLLPTYTNNDIKELARVFTGMSWSTNSASNTNWDTPNLDRTNPSSGWYDDGTGNLWYSSRFNYPMAFYNNQHDNGSKTIAGGKVINNNGTADGRYTSEGDKDLRDVLNYFAGTQTNQLSPKSFAGTWSTDPMVNHQSTPAFVSRRLIQRLVTSNPSGSYVYRVAQVWRNTNGQLDEVVRAILLDSEARNLSTTELNREFGKKKEPLLAWLQGVRAIAGRSRVTFDGTVISGDPVDFPNQTHRFPLNPTANADLRNFDYPQTEINKFLGAVAYDNMGEMISAGAGSYQRLAPTTMRINAMDGSGTNSLNQTPLKAPTVFNWFLPDYQPGGLIANYGLFAPEFQLATESSVFQNINTFWTSHWGTSGFGGTTMGGNNNNSDSAGFTTVSGNNGTNHTDDNVIVDYWAWIYRYENYPDIPDNGLNTEQDKVLQLIDDLDALLLAGRYKLLYPVDTTNDGTPVTQGGLTHYPNRNPRETILHYIADTYNDNASMSNQWNKVRAALYMMTTTPEFLIQK
ncbi:MAG: DUF1800 family protein [Verrucomicrobiota bacterium]